MISISELKIVEDTFFRTNLSYYKPSTYSIIEKYFNEENEFSEATVVKLKHLVKGNADMAYNTVLQEDIDFLSKEINNAPKQFDEQLWRDMLPKIREEVKKYLGLDFKPRSIFFNAAFPEGLWSFEKKGASSVTIFEGSKDAGIYFLNKRISSFFTPVFLIHEQLHSCLSQNKDKSQMYIEWFEEGICQWFSAKIYYSLTKNMDVLDYYKERCLIYSKVKDEHNFTRRYLEYMKIMSRLYLNGGEELIGKIMLAYMSNDRELVNSYLNVEKLPIRHLPKNEIDNYLCNFSFTIEPEKIPPIEYLILRETFLPKTIEQVFEKIHAPQNLLKKAIFNMQLKGLIVIKDNIEINWRKKDLFEKGLIKPYWPLGSK